MPPEGTGRFMHNSGMQSAPNNEFLPEPLPREPFALFKDWFDIAWAQRLQPNANSMVLATVDTRGNPAARVVLCKQIVTTPGYLVFFTNYESDKGEHLAKHSRAAVVFHWDALHRQVRMTGPVVKSPADESDRYFAMRPLASRIGAWASHQSRPLMSRAQLVAQIDAVMERFHLAIDATEGTVPRPPHWGGYRLWPESVELWTEGPGRVHDRAIWTRNVSPLDELTFTCGAWSATRLNP
jgi:pyridoxamine 5'-phosphate oxidase